MSHSSKVCTCGARFQLQVELAVHCHATGHAPYQGLAAVAAPAPTAALALAGPAARNLKMTIVSALALVSLIGLTCGLNATVRSYTSWKYTSNVLMLP